MAKVQFVVLPASPKARCVARGGLFSSLCLICLLLAGCAGAGSPALSAAAGRSNQPVAPAAGELASDSAPGAAELTRLLLQELARLGVDPAHPRPAAAPVLKAGSRGFYDYGMGAGRELAFKVDSLTCAGWSGDPDGPEGALAPSVATLQWVETLTGDYDQNGEVGLTDITPIAQYWGKPVEYTEVTEDGETRRVPAGDPLTDGARNWRLAAVDGNGDGEINAQDLTPLAQSFGLKLDGYSILWYVPGGGGMFRFIDCILDRPAAAADGPVVYTYTLDFSQELQTLYLTDEDLAYSDGSYGVPINAPPPGRYYVRALAAGSSEPIEVADSNLARVQYDPPAVASAFTSPWLAQDATSYTSYFANYNLNCFDLDAGAMTVASFNHPSTIPGSSISRSSVQVDECWDCIIKSETAAETAELDSVDFHPEVGYFGAISLVHDCFNPNWQDEYLFRISPAGTVEWQSKLGFKRVDDGAGILLYPVCRQSVASSGAGAVIARSGWLWPTWNTYALIWQDYGATGENRLTAAFKIMADAQLIPYPRRIALDGAGRSIICGSGMYTLDEAQHDCYFVCAISPAGKMLSFEVVEFAHPYTFIDSKVASDGACYMLFKDARESGTDLVLARFDSDSQFAWAREFNLLDTEYDRYINLALAPTGAAAIGGTWLMPDKWDNTVQIQRPTVALFDEAGTPLRAYYERIYQADKYGDSYFGLFCGLVNDPVTGELRVLSRAHKSPFQDWGVLEFTAAPVAPVRAYAAAWTELQLAANDAPSTLRFDFYRPDDGQGRTECWSMPLPLGE